MGLRGRTYTSESTVTAKRCRIRLSSTIATWRVVRALVEDWDSPSTQKYSSTLTSQAVSSTTANLRRIFPMLEIPLPFLGFCWLRAREETSYPPMPRYKQISGETSFYQPQV